MHPSILMLLDFAASSAPVTSAISGVFISGETVRLPQFSGETVRLPQFSGEALRVPELSQ